MKFGTVNYSINYHRVLYGMKCVILRRSMNCGAFRNTTMFGAVLYGMKNGTLQCSKKCCTVKSSMKCGAVQ